MMKEPNRLISLKRRKMFLGAALLFASMGIAQANPTETSLSSANSALVVASAQQAKVSITGTVQDPNGPIIGATIMEKGTNNGVVTDLDGKFNISVSPKAVLVVAFIGYVEQEIQVGGKTNFTVNLVENAQALDEVVVVGYGTQKKVNLTGSISSVNVGEMAQSRPLTSIATALAGAAPGVQITSGNNIPSSNGDADIKVRGQGTLNNSSPLIIVDGVESSMSSVSPQDVETLTVLKDAASSAIYGSRAANGVILITTKQGKAGKMKVDYTGYVSFQTLKQPYEVVSDYADYMGYINEGLSNSGKAKPFSQATIDLWREKSKDPNGLTDKGIPNYLAYPNSDLFDVYQTGVSQQHSISASGGSEKISYYTSFNYLNNPGILENTGYERYSLRVNVDAQVKSWLKVGANLSGYIGTTTPVSENMTDIYRYNLTGGTPGMAFRDDQGRLGVIANPEDDPQATANNPYSRLQGDGTIRTNAMKARMYVVLTPMKGLTLQGSYTYDYYDKYKETKTKFIPMWNFLTNTQYTTGEVQTSVYNYNEKKIRNFMDATARYDRNFFDNRLTTSLMIGASQEQYSRNYFGGSRKDLLDPSLGVLDGAIGDNSISGNKTEFAMRSFFGRLNLGWDSKYLLEVNLRADGSSRFTPEKRWGYFPSFSAAWRISEENFMKDMRWLNNLKLRASYGSLGNNTLGGNRDDDGNYSSQSVFAQSNYILNNAISLGLSQPAIANAMLTWETTYVTNIGIDFSVLNNRLSGTIDYFNKRTAGILIDLPAPLVHGNASIPKQNAAQVTNKGLEFSANWADKAGNSGLNYNVGFNVTYIKNNVDKFKGEEITYSGARILKEGLPIWSLYVREVDRLVQTEEDLALVQTMLDNPAVAGKAVFSSGTPKKGDLLYKDLNGDGLVNDDDRKIMGKGQNPTLNFGMNLGFDWKGIDLSILFQGVAGLDDLYQSSLFQSNVRYGYQVNKEVAEGSWREGSTNIKYPRLLDSSDERNLQNSDFWITSKDYLKIRNITLGYTLPKVWTKAANIERIRFYGSMENFFTFTKWKGYDPEVNGITYPTMRQVVMGVNVTF